jgi:hypothetical protein
MHTISMQWYIIGIGMQWYWYGIVCHGISIGFGIGMV